MPQVVQRLVSGQAYILDQSMHVGLSILQALETHLGKPPSTAPYAQRKRFERSLRQASEHLWVQIRDAQYTIKGIQIPAIFDTLYPEVTDCWMPLVHLQTLVGSDMRYQSGIHYPVLGHRLHPFYDVYAPTRTEHLELFATWLRQYQGDRIHAVDVGTGSGILTYLLAKSGVPYIDAVDQNPNAIYSLDKELERHPLESVVNTKVGDLLCNIESSPLIVFNPPWIPGDTSGSVDEALFYQGGLFERFFDQAHKCCTHNGRIVLIFSNILTLLRPDLPHPIETELTKNRFTLVNKMTRRIKPPKGSKRRTKERVEIWELRVADSEANNRTSTS